MQTYHVRLQSEISKTFRCQRAADSLDIDTEKKSIHELSIQADLDSKFNVGLILGASGSGKTTLAKSIFGNDCFKIEIQADKPIIDQLPKDLTYDQCAEILSGIGLTSVPCWIRPVYTLSNGQRSRAEAALAMSKSEDFVILDEWTSVVDRTVAKVMSHCVQKFARRQNKKIVLLSCHYDVIEWLNPDWIIDCNHQKYLDRRLLHPDERRRKESIQFDIREIDRSSWKYFSKYHYLSDKVAGGKNYFFGLFQGNTQIGFQAFSNYVPIRKGSIPIFHFNRTVIHPDYSGLGLGLLMINECSKYLKQKYGYRIMGKFSSMPVFKSLSKNSCWKLLKIERQIGERKGWVPTGNGFRKNVKTFSFVYVG